MPTSRRTTLQAIGATGLGASFAGCSAPSDSETERTRKTSEQAAKKPTADRVAADPTDIPDPIDRDEPKHHDITLTVEEVRAEVEEGVVYDYMTFEGQIPGPMIRVREGDTISFTMENAPENTMPHNVDMHAIYGTGGGAEATTAAPGESADERFKVTYPGAYIYHCAVPNMDYHISSGMFGMILVEPKDGLPEADREFYFGQHELYTDKDAGEKGHHKLDMEAMKAEDPTYVLLNGEKYAITPEKYGPVEAKQDETVRVFMVDGGPNLSSNFHPIGNVWTKAYRDGGLAGTAAEEYIQTMKVPPGSCMVGTLDTPVPETIKLVDHALSRVTRKGMLGLISVKGEERPKIFDPDPSDSSDGSSE